MTAAAPKCTHGIAQQHRAPNGNWRCSACGSVGAWSAKWRVVTHKKCEACGCVPINVVACSGACMLYLRSAGVWR